MSDDITVRDDPAAHRFRIALDGRDVGFAAYRREPGRVVFTHTEIDDAAEGHGLGGRLARAALDQVAARGEQVVPLCPFIAAWIGRHPDYIDLVVPEHRHALQG